MNYFYCRSTESTFTVSYLGPEGTYSESALEGQFGRSVDKLPEENIKKIFESVSLASPILELCQLKIQPKAL